MTDSHIILLGGWVLLLAFVILIVGWLGVKNGSLICLVGKMQLGNAKEILELKELIQEYIVTKERKYPNPLVTVKCPWECAYEKILRDHDRYPVKNSRANSYTQSIEDPITLVLPKGNITPRSPSQLELGDSHNINTSSEKSVLVIESLIASMETQTPICTNGEMEGIPMLPINNREEKIVQTDEIESVTVSICSNCSYSSPRAFKKEIPGNEKKSGYFLLESESRPGIYQPPIRDIKRRDSIFDFSSDISLSSKSSSGENLSMIFDRKMSMDMESDSDSSEWRKVPERKSHNAILLCELDKPRTLVTPSPAVSPSPWNSTNFHLAYENKMADLRDIQQNLVNQIKVRKQFFLEKDIRSPIIIGVDARPTYFSGYCLNLRTHACQFYTFPSKSLPWRLQAEIRKEGNPSEFEMKNMMFALLLWEKEIEKYKKFAIFTDNRAVNTPNCQYGKAVTTFLEHFTGCKDVVRVNSNSHIHRKHDADAFARIIQPADDLSHFQFEQFHDFMKKIYGNISFSGTHELQDYRQVNLTERYPNSSIYKTMLDKATQAAKNWTKPCASCGFCFPLKTLRSDITESQSMQINLLPDNFEEKSIFSLYEDFPCLM